MGLISGLATVVKRNVSLFAPGIEPQFSNRPACTLISIRVMKQSLQRDCFGYKLYQSNKNKHRMGINCLISDANLRLRSKIMKKLHRSKPFARHSLHVRGCGLHHRGLSISHVVCFITCYFSDFPGDEIRWNCLSHSCCF